MIGAAVLTVGVAIVALLIFVATRRFAMNQRGPRPMSGQRAVALVALGLALIALGALFVSCASFVLQPTCCNP